jgi:hypothetical protein
MQVLGIRLKGLSDLIRLAISLKREKAVILTYPINKNLYEAGLYLPPFSKELSAVYPYIRIAEKLRPVYSYSSNESGRESIKEGFIKSSTYLPVYTIYLKQVPHNYIDLNKVEYEITTVELEDVNSLANVSLSTLDSWMYLPFVWYDTDNEKFVLSLEVNPRDDISGELLVLHHEYRALPSHANFIAYNPEKGEVTLTSGFTGLNYQYVSIIRSFHLPYFR